VVQDPERREEGEQQRTDVGLQESTQFLQQNESWDAGGSGCEDKGGQEEKQIHQEVSVCRGMKPAPTCLTLLILQELLKETKST